MRARARSATKTPNRNTVRSPKPRRGSRPKKRQHGTVSIRIPSPSARGRDAHVIPGSHRPTAAVGTLIPLILQTQH